MSEQTWRRDVKAAVAAIVAAGDYSDPAGVEIAALAVAERVGYVERAPVQPYSVAQYAVRQGLAAAPNTRPTSSGVEFPLPADDDVALDDRPADAAYEQTWADVRDEIMALALYDLRKRLKALPDEAVQAAQDALAPVLKAVLDGQVSRHYTGWTERQQRLFPVVQGIVEPRRAQLLALYGTVPGTRQTPGMRRGRATRTSGPASQPIRPRQGDQPPWVLHDDRATLITDEAAARIAGELTLKPAKVGTEKDEERWDRLQQAMRPAKTPGRNTGKQKGRLGGPAVIR